MVPVKENVTTRKMAPTMSRNTSEISNDVVHILRN